MARCEACVEREVSNEKRQPKRDCDRAASYRWRHLLGAEKVPSAPHRAIKPNVDDGTLERITGSSMQQWLMNTNLTSSNKHSSAAGLDPSPERLEALFPSLTPKPLEGMCGSPATNLPRRVRDTVLLSARHSELERLIITTMWFSKHQPARGTWMGVCHVAVVVGLALRLHDLVWTGAGIRAGCGRLRPAFRGTSPSSCYRRLRVSAGRFA